MFVSHVACCKSVNGRRFDKYVLSLDTFSTCGSTNSVTRWIGWSPIINKILESVCMWLHSWITARSAVKDTGGNKHNLLVMVLGTLKTLKK